MQASSARSTSKHHLLRELIEEPGFSRERPGFFVFGAWEEEGMFGEGPGCLWPADDDKSREVREVYARFGLAIYQVQVLEHGVVNAIVALTLFKERASYSTKEQWWEAVDRRFQQELAQTFGNLLRKLTSMPRVNEALMDRIRAAKEPRDIIAHRFFRLHAEDFMHQAGRRRMIVWCEDQIAMFRELDILLEQIYSESLEAVGVTKEWLSARIDEELARQGVVSDLPYR